MKSKKAAIVRGLRALCGQVVAGRYRLDELLAVGGMGAVFRARHLQLEKDVAVKLLRPDLSNNNEVCARLQREAKLLSRLDHPNCVRVFDFGNTREGTRYLVMELLRGRDLAGIITKPIPPALAVDLVGQVLDGLDHAHRRGVLHRDVKPGNIRLVTDEQGRNLVKVCDFGIAKSVGSGKPDTIITQIGTIFGTPVYMSPEQAAGQDIDHRADLYSVGVVLYEMLAGDPPFQHPDPIALLHAKMSGQIPPLENVPSRIVEVVQCLMAVEREHRYPSARDAARALRGAAEHERMVRMEVPKDWYAAADAVLPPVPADEGPAKRSDTSILRAFGAGLDKVLNEPTPHAGDRLVTGIHGSPEEQAADAQAAAERYIDIDNLQLEEIGGDHDRAED